MIDQKIISIVTVVFNGANQIEKTILSILNQSYKKIQFIIIDGGSIDGTKEIINKYKDKINIFISERDNGIYDAMNKGIKYSTGDWVIFMNCGDIFFDTNSLNIFQNHNKFDNKILLYGSTSFLRKGKVYIKPPRNLKNIWKGMPICHQSMFIRTSFLRNNLFNTNYTYASDFNQLYEIYLFDYKRIEKLNLPISIITINGFSETNSIDTYKEYMDISLKNNNYNYLIFIYYKYQIMQRKVIHIIKKYLC